MRLVPQPGGAFVLVAHGCGVRVGGAHPEIRYSPVAPPNYLPVLATSFGDPAVLACVLLCQRSPFLARGSHDGGDPRGACILGQRPLLGEDFSQVLLEAVLQVLQVLQKRTRPRRVQRGIGLDLRSIEVQLLTPHQPCLEALLHDPLEEAPEDREAVSLPDPGEAGVVGQGLVQVVPEVPANAQPVSRDLHEPALRADVLEEHHQLQAEEDHGIDARTARRSVVVLDEVPDEREVERRLEATVEVVLGDQMLQRDFAW